LKPRLRALILLAVLCLAAGAAAYAGVDTAWVRRYDGPAHGDDWATRIAVDTAGNVYVTGASASDTSSSAQYLDFVTIKYYPNGDTAWVRRADFGGKDIPYGLSVDAQGNVYVAGSNNDSRMVAVKYSQTGNRLWYAFFGTQGGTTDLALDHQGNALVCGHSLKATTDGAVLKYRPDGDTAWARFLDWAGYEDYAIALATGGPLDVVVAAEGYNGSSGSDYVTVKYDSTGTQQWLAAYTGPVDWDAPEDVATDAAGNVYVAGSSVGSASSWDFLTIKYDSTGETLWTLRYDGPANGDDEARAVGVDSAGNAYVTGSVTVATGHPNCATIKYAPDGQQLWVALFGGPIANYGRSSAVALDGCGGVYVCGVSAFSAGAYGDYATVKYNAATGDTVWVKGYNGPGSDVDLAQTIAVDPSGCVYVTGESYGGSGTAMDIATIKYVQNGGVAEESHAPPAIRRSLVAEPSVFGSRTTVRLYVGRAAVARVLVFDVDGRRVRSLVSGRDNASAGAVAWDGRDDSGVRLPPGVYLVVLEAGDERAQAKVVMSE
jgi:hypothetical protein